MAVSLRWAAVVLLGPCTSQSLAHRSRSSFSAATVVIRGEVTRLEWKNPHVHVFVRETSGNGSGSPSGTQKPVVERYALADDARTLTIDYVL